MVNRYSQAMARKNGDNHYWPQHCRAGVVYKEPSHQHWLGATDSTCKYDSFYAELSAVTWALQWIIQKKDCAPSVIYADNQAVIHSAEGIGNLAIPGYAVQAMRTTALIAEQHSQIRYKHVHAHDLNP